MKLYRKQKNIWVESDNSFYKIDMNWDQLVNRKGLHSFLLSLLPSLPKDESIDANASFDPPAVSPVRMDSVINSWM